MSVQYRKSKSLGNGRRLNISHRGVGVSQRVGPLSVSSRGNLSLRLAPGLSFRSGGKNAGAMAGVMLAVLAVMLLLWSVKVAAVLLWRVAIVVGWGCRWVWFALVGLLGRVRSPHATA